MLKMYHTTDFAGSSPEFWESNWKSVDFNSQLRFCQIDPLRRVFEQYSSPGSLVLEGGCGTGHYVTYYSYKGRRMFGLDFAQSTLKRLKERVPGLYLASGDVSKLPFADETFDLYYSGGVVEHFENGCAESLDEARRVLKTDGTLMLSVPYFSPLRRALMGFKRNEWRVVAESKSDESRHFDNRTFFQYAYKKEEFTKQLENAGLKVTSTFGYSVLWGLKEIPVLAKLGDGSPKVANIEEENEAPVREVVESTPSTSFLKRLIIEEDDRIPVAGLAVKLMRWSSANMMMYICSRR